MMEKKYTDEKNYLSVRIKWCALLAAGLIGAFLVRMWVVCIREKVEVEWQSKEQPEESEQTTVTL